MNSSLLKDIKYHFPNEYATHTKFTYKPCIHDYLVLAQLINKHVFKKLSLSQDNINIVFEKQSGQNKLGKFRVGRDGEAKAVIVIILHDYDECFSQQVSVLCHELIHYYDFSFKFLKEKFEKFGYLSKDVNSTNRETVDGYDVHGAYFHLWIKKFAEYGIFIKERMNLNDNKLMKKIKENNLTDSFFTTKFNKVLTETDDIIKTEVEALANSIKGAEVKTKFIDKDHWYIEFD